MQRLAITNLKPSWIVVQPDRYRYLAMASESVVIRLVIREYLGAEVIWN